MTWKESVKQSIVDLTSISQTKQFTRQELIDRELSNILKRIKSEGKTPEQTLSRILQYLRDDGFIDFTTYHGDYKLNNPDGR